MINRILIVCVGNICRSPMAEGLFAHKLKQRNSAIHVASAGLAGLTGHPADPIAQELMLEREIDISGHRARRLDAELLKISDLVLVMEDDQIKAAEALSFNAKGRVFCLGKWRDIEIDDPYRQPRHVFEHCLGLIEQGVEDWLNKL